MRTLRELLEDSGVHVLDGAMGTMLYSRGVFVNVCYDELTLKQPGLVQEVHETYVRAGAEILETNTFGANPVKLSGYGLDDRTEEINRAAAELAHRAARGRALVVGAVGPLGIRIEPWGPTARTEAVVHFSRQTSGLAEGGVDGFILETFSDLEEIHAALEAARAAAPDLPVIAQMTVGEDGTTSYGTPVETIAARLIEWGADVVGLNCSVGPAPMLEAIERMADVSSLPLSAQPNAGLPRAVGDRRIYLASPDYMAQYARRLTAAGARFIGGCCGTTPEHIRRIRECVADARPRRVAVGVPAIPQAEAAGAREVPLAARSEWARKLSDGLFVRSVEIVPPRGWDPAGMLAQCRALREAGVDAVNLVDGSRAQSRMGVVPAALLVEREVGLETVFHYTCRDRNMLGMLSDLLGAAAGGLRNVLIVTGDPPTAGPYPDATAVFDIDSIGLTNVVRRLNQGLDPGGTSIGEPTRYVIGVAANQGAIDRERELERFHWKVEAGAEFAVTQPVFDPAELAGFLERIAPWRIPVIAGIWPLTSLRNAEFLANEVPGAQVPEDVLERMRGAEARGPEAAHAEGIRIAQEVLDAVRGMVQGVQVSTPGGRVEVALEALGQPADAAATELSPLP
ncbi:MAG TPA: bifunctional homocysteine S-methyltransferase/methylenetetrahydrofolate reductase [Gemmatimonadales bacterium]|nr:bifunctional homocysteine S-methyltransferase/methylenetetrahydrofolate reductase [Gemmatimonadales bacterium]